MAILIWAVLVIIGFFITRMFWLWYFRIDEIAGLLKNIEAHLEILSGQIVEKKESQAVPEAPSAPIETKCKQCGSLQDTGSDSIFCDQCGTSLTR